MKIEFETYNFKKENIQLSDHIQIHELEHEKPSYNSSQFQHKKDFLKTLLQQQTTNNASDKINLTTEKTKSLPTLQIAGVDSIQFYNWKNIKNISARLIATFDNVVVLECLVNKEEKIYEEREFEVSLFEGYNLEGGKLFFLRYFQRPNEARIEVHDDPNLTFESDFPKLNFNDLFKTSKLFNP